MEEIKKNTHGGKRGGGRPALREDKVRLAVEIERELFETLRAACWRAGDGTTPLPRWRMVTEALKNHLMVKRVGPD